ncbi:tRNA cyclic N6-threonylcarbamoyladenosine(37) synthase TcdA [Helicobacter valdiviensis]|uniref:tRNA cyclic N6-threonylcarbamoyladenosine(37) synthase TcdA n=2 Tax=Helicobacter valdiviensis TaxID=1458358 RepID=A0A2W6MTQ6_9HELI|nr:tRNA cyclic N6-threonylcarbamoyladenosine(37) synthase TcdA [Helicobacter valdiviensis]
MSTRFARTLLLFKEEGFTKLQNASVLLFGVGGVGSFALDCLYRSGVGKICIVDGDCFDITNQNRQIGSFEGLGEKKVEVLAKMYPNINYIAKRFSPQDIEEFDFSSYDVVLDAIDDIPTKISLALKIANKPKIKNAPLLLSSTGSAKKLDPGEIRCANIWKSYGDKFARKFREGLKKQNFRGDFKVIFSPEIPKCKELGSFSAVTGSFGLRLASEAISHILKENK